MNTIPLYRKIVAPICPLHSACRQWRGCLIWACASRQPAVPALSMWRHLQSFPQVASAARALLITCSPHESVSRAAPAGLPAADPSDSQAHADALHG